MKRKILYIIDNITFGGGERGFAQIINNINKDKFEIYAACLHSGLFVDRIKDKANIIPLDLTNQLNLFNIFKIIKIIRDNNIDIVHSQGSRADFYSRIASRLTRHNNLPAVVCTVQMPPEGFDVGIIKKVIYVGIDRLTERFVDRFTVVSKALEKCLIETHKIPINRVKLINNGIETGEYEYNNEAAEKIRAELGIEKDTVLIGTIGRLVWQKGLEYFIDAVDILSQKFTDLNQNVKFLVVGEGPMRKNLEIRVKNLGLTNRVIFAGFRKDIKEILCALDLLVMASVLEGQPMILLEGMAVGKAIVATDIEGINETVVNGVSGLLAPPKNPKLLADTIISLVKDENKRRQMGINARRIVEEKFDFSKIVRQYEYLYDQSL